MGELIALGALVILVLVLMGAAVRVIQQSYVGIVQRVGRYQRTIGPGVHLLVPMLDRVATLCRTVNAAVIADADTGYGNELNVFRTVREFERAGVAAIHIEDQITPKRCGHLDGKEVISLAEMTLLLQYVLPGTK